VEADPPKSAPFSLFSLSDSLSHVLSSPSIESQIKRKKQIVKKKKKGGKRKEKRERERETRWTTHAIKISQINKKN
jgi:hypothetical protein